MPSPLRASTLIACLVASAIALAAKPVVVIAGSGCTATYAVLGQMPGLTGPTPTVWFNVIGRDFDPSIPATLTFGVPVIPYSLDDPRVVEPAVTTFSIPAETMSTSFKWTFRAQEADVRTIRVRVAGNGCHTAVVVDLSPPATSTADAMATPGDGLTPGPILLLIALAGGMLITDRRLGRRARCARTREHEPMSRSV
jgi:hypothetical protein